MAANEPIDPVVRLAISQWPDDAPRGAVSTFCAEHGLSRKSFYELRKRARVEGQAAVLEPRSRRPRSSPSKLTDIVKAQAIAVRKALETSGLDHGPISVHDKMASMGLPVVPSPPALARIFREAGVARLEPKKKPRAAWRRFVYPAPNACWQLDGTEYVLTGGRTCVVFQLIDDHSRYAVASHVAWGETSQAAITVVDKGITAHGVPQRLLTDNGLALNPSRRGHIGRLVVHLSAMGVDAITGKPYKPTTQGKNERFHQTLFRWLDAAGAGLIGSDEPISAGDLRRLCDGGLLPAVLGGPSEVLDVGRERRRLVTPEIRAALDLRDGGCIFPGCQTRACSCEAHHVLPWLCGGKTALCNLCLLCHHHHALLEPARYGTRDQWEVRIAEDGIPEVIPPRRYDPQ